jgi:hypothetical protein
VAKATGATGEFLLERSRSPFPYHHTPLDPAAMQAKNNALQYDNNVERVAMQRRLVADDQWVRPICIYPVVSCARHTSARLHAYAAAGQPSQSVALLVLTVMCHLLVFRRLGRFSHRVRPRCLAVFATGTCHVLPFLGALSCDGYARCDTHFLDEGGSESS